jgi:tetratricopeptide (TPR) repeat protein
MTRTLGPLKYIVLTSCLISFAAAQHEHMDHGSPKIVGKVDFPVSCSKTAQTQIEQGLAMLHSFLFADAEEDFRAAGVSDPTCAMAPWAQAIGLYRPLAYLPSDEDTRNAWSLLQKAKALQPKTPRERDYIAAAEAIFDPAVPKFDDRNHHYSEALKRLRATYPDDTEAAVFYALSLITLSGDNHQDNPQANAEEAIAILNPIFEQHPDHPGIAHYLIHASDSPQLASQGLAAARRYAEIAPASPHALHMPSHIFARLGLWQEDIRSNLAALKAARDPSAHVGAENQVHSLEFIEYAYLQLGDNAKAEEALEEQKKALKVGIDPHLTGYVDNIRMRSTALLDLEMHNWNAAEGLEPKKEMGPYNESIGYWAQAIAAGHLKERAAAEHALAEYDLMVSETKRGPKPFIAEKMQIPREEAQGWVFFAQGRNEDAIKSLRAAAEQQEVNGKGEIELPAREMLADLLIEMGRPRDALVEYEKSMTTDPNRFNGLYGAGTAAESIGDRARARNYFEQLLKNCSEAQPERPELVHARQLLTRN